jgi:hypothetical protein
MNPGVDVACTGVLPQAAAVANSVSATAGSVASPRTISTSGISGAGLKKCSPATRPGTFMPAASAVIDSDEVFDARIASAATMRSRSPKSSRFTPASSTIASTTSFALTHAPGVCTGSIRPAAERASSALIRPFDASVSNVAASLRAASSAAPVRASNSSTRWPACAATCAMPAPIAPAPMTATTASRGSACPFAIDYFPVNRGARFSTNAATPSR